MISLDDDRCASCGCTKAFHEKLLGQYGSIRYVLPRKPLVAFWTTNSEIPPTEDLQFDYRECRKFDPVMQIFDREGNLI